MAGINSLLGLIDQGKRNVKNNLELLRNAPEAFFQRLADDAQQGTRAVEADPSQILNVMNPVSAGLAGVIKQKGGNWLTGSIPKAVENLRPSTYTAEGIAAARRGEFPDWAASAVLNEAALSNWIDKQLSRYVQNDMATPHAPIRELAGQGILHTDLQHRALAGESISRKRIAEGFPPEGMGKSDLAKGWGYAADVQIFPPYKGDIEAYRRSGNRVEALTKQLQLEPENLRTPKRESSWTNPLRRS